MFDVPVPHIIWPSEYRYSDKHSGLLLYLYPVPVSFFIHLQFDTVVKKGSEKFVSAFFRCCGSETIYSWLILLDSLLQEKMAPVWAWLRKWKWTKDGISLAKSPLLPQIVLLCLYLVEESGERDLPPAATRRGGGSLGQGAIPQGTPRPKGESSFH